MNLISLATIYGLAIPIVVVFALGMVVVAFVRSGWLPATYFRTRLKAAEARAAERPTALVAAGVASTGAYRTADLGNEEPNADLARLKDRAAAWDRRWETNRPRLRQSAYAGLVMLAVAGIFALGRCKYAGMARANQARLEQAKTYDVALRIVGKACRCETGRIDDWGKFIVERDVYWTGDVHDFTDVGTEEGLRARRITYYALVEATADYPIIRRGTRFVTQESAGDYARMRIGATDWAYLNFSRNSPTIDPPTPALKLNGEGWNP